MEKWYVASCKTKFGSQRRAAENLTRQQFEIFNPRIGIKSTVKGISIEALFPGYIFIKFDPLIRSASLINNCVGVIRLLIFGNVLVAVKSGVVDQLIQKYSGKLEVIDKSLKAGQVVELKEGPLVGFNAVFKESIGERRSILMIGAIDLSREVIVENSCFF